MVALRAFRACLLALAVFGIAGAGARADQADPALPALFDKLKMAPSPASAQPIEKEIWRRWGTIDDSIGKAMLEEASAAMAAGAFDLARHQLDALIEREPGFAEAWNRRATLNYLIGDHAASVRDIEHVLKLEPRHFGALSGLGLIMLKEERLDAALRSFEAALAVNPHLPAARTHVDWLRERVEGKPI